MPAHLLVLACPPDPETLMWYRLQEVGFLVGVLFTLTLLLLASIIVGVHSARVLSR